MTKEKIEAMEIYDTCKKFSHATVGKNRVNDAKFRASLMADKMIIEYDRITDEEVPIDFIIERMEFWENVKEELKTI